VSGGRVGDPCRLASATRARDRLLDLDHRPRWVVGLLWDGASCGDLLHLAETGGLPGVARLVEHGLAPRGGAVAEFPSVGPGFVYLGVP
jgi:hypothetical protein